MAYIKSRGLSIEFPLNDVSNRSLKREAFSLVTGGKVGSSPRHKVTIKALDNISFDLKPGDRLGLLGHNGSGKSTLLKALAGVYAPTSGSLESRGQITSLLDITLGMDMDATGFENIILRGLMLGHTPQKMKELTPEIAEFSELGEYLRLPARIYSSGMLVRLGFAISTAVPSDIVLMDEWLAVGDADFQKKANDKLKEMTERAAILVIASHMPSIIENICNRTICLEKGIIVSDSFFE
ncbi:sugar ABC transporter ATP-binding protein [Caballeronia mineralivorans PML1(12)]|uniref:Sugar ABC transporter ATP-binding protein n=1 Tax=Caballeronia mineralivorans PML1(12) TaxID=908627 RepID=A0A0J1D549_9BURK|nr:ABC transporter ATP-binding protein [Caballeronia mineralivorans]KLU27756.1 sugar ABC transporter ATP-binding protein [Caballeronia mineralivorans PML1(12)]